MNFTIPWSVLVSDNRKHVTRRVLSPEYRLAKKSLALIARAQVRGEAFTGPCEVRYDFHPPDRRRRDCANFLKLLNDALEGVVWADDFLIKRLSFEVHEPTDDPRVDVEAVAL
jgi:Holliday junction resolvase RusA-like endonuclease